MLKRLFKMSILFFLSLAIVFNLTVSPVFALTEEQKLLNEAWRIVNRAYLDETFNNQNWWVVRERLMKQPLPDRSATYNAIMKMLASLDDPFTRLLKPDQYHSLQVSTSGELTGVGLQIALDEESGELTVIAPIAGSPAEQAGLQPLDIILKIDDVPVTQMTLDEAANRMRGPSGTTVKLTIKREDEVQNLNLVRSLIEINPVTSALKSGPHNISIGYIRLSQFSAHATTEMAQAIKTLAKQGAQGYILDLRNNPGGLLQAGIEIARLWINQGPIVYTVNRQGVLGTVESSKTALTNAPLVVLVNKGTASASEILAGALKDDQRAKLVGEKTFGKGLIQSLFDLSDGSGLAVTVAKYETPNHIDIHKQGIMPDVEVPSISLTKEEIATIADPQYQKAIEILSSR